MTELLWDGKYDANGKRTQPVRTQLPFQTVETVNESVVQRMSMWSALQSGDEPTWRNRLIWGDKKYVLPSLLPEFAGKVNLIYIDPPFATGANFSFTTTIPESEQQLTKEPNAIETKAYRDTWGKGLDSYLQWFSESVVLLRDLLAEDGSIYVHCDWHVDSYIRAVMDEVFGSENFQNEIIWSYFAFKRSTTRKFPQKHDVIISFHKNEESYHWNVQYKEHKLEYLKRWKQDETGRSYRNDVNPTKGGKRTIYLDEIQGDIVDSVWNDIPPVNPVASEKVDYPTQKPEALLERIIKASSNEGDLVLDCFCGSGTTAAVAEKLNRRWITCDLGRFAIHTARKRLLGLENVTPFVVQNLGKYERRIWQAAEFSGGVGVPQGARVHGEMRPSPAMRRETSSLPTDVADVIGGAGIVEVAGVAGGIFAEQELTYRKFILDLYHATPLEGSAWFHGSKAGRLVHIGSVDAPIALGEVKSIALEHRKLYGEDVKLHGIDILGWDFAFEINETAKQMTAQAGLDISFKLIPREVMEKKAVDQGDIRFYEMAALDVGLTQKKLGIAVSLRDFMMPPDDVPADVQSAITHWSQWIDYWAVDWEYRDDTFHNQWQSYRTKKEPKLQLTVSHDYDTPGTYTVVVKVIDILGNDTTKTLSVVV